MSIGDDEDNYHLYKILLLGDISVGKSCLLLRYCDNSYQESHLATIGLDFRVRIATLDDKRKIKVQIWDTAGQDRFRAITRNYYRGSNGILLIYDVTEEKSFEHIRDWIAKIRDEASEDIIIYLVANKIDNNNKRIITNEEGKKLAQEFKIAYYETSAKCSIGVDKVFEDLIKEMDDRYLESHQDEMQSVKINKNENVKKKKKCCK